MLYSDDDGEDLDLVCDENPDYLYVCSQETPITERGRLLAGDCTTAEQYYVHIIVHTSADLSCAVLSLLTVTRTN